ncbi:MAG: Rpn family recombination-promoting nuclease/putative transposase [Lachnospiraceae bacterium]|nr:Rpn family recombination-promoting nuclease/putative transposase [Lachnospiraceae bacterium]
MNDNKKIKNMIPFATLEEATGMVPYNMLNDYMFRAVLQANNKVLCGLIRSLLHLPEEYTLKAEITNPILLGEAIENKEFRLDIYVNINDEKILNLEMQVANQLNWNNRSLAYLCRSYDQLNKGENYDTIKPVIHIGFLNFTLFEDEPQFFAKYKFMNTENHRIYSDNLELCVLDLTQIELATKEDKLYQIDYWAALFKAKTWEEMKMLAKQSEYLEEATKTVFRMSAEDLVIKRCRDREDYYADIRSYQKAVAKRDALIEEKDATIAELRAEREEMLEEIERLRKLEQENK